LLLAVAVALCSLWTTMAQASTVAIWRSKAPSAELSEALFRLQGELLALGLGVRVVEAHGPDAQTVAANEGADALIEVTTDGETLGIAVWVFAQPALHSDVSNVNVRRSDPDAAKTLAIRAIEVLRSRLLELDLAARPKEATKDSRADAARPVPPGASSNVTSPVSDRMGIAAGAAMLMSLDGVGPAFLPVLRVEWAPRSWFFAQATLAGLGSRPKIESELGSADVAQSYAVLGFGYSATFRSGLRPFVGLAAGALRTSLDGRAASPNEGHTIALWSFLMDGSIGASLPIRGPIYLTLASHLQMAAPYVSVHFVDRTVASSGRPNLVFTLTAGAWL
jgi:hypothetical protein